MDTESIPAMLHTVCLNTVCYIQCVTYTVCTHSVCTYRCSNDVVLDLVKSLCGL